GVAETRGYMAQQATRASERRGAPATPQGACAPRVPVAPPWGRAQPLLPERHAACLVGALLAPLPDRLGICRKFSLEAICGMVSPGDPRYKEKESDHGGELQGGPFPQGYHPDGCALVRRVTLELSACRRTDGGARG